MPDPVLIVDDDPVQRRLLEMAVAKFGHEPLSVASGEEAVDLLSRHAPLPRTIILDLMMPGMSGLDVMKHMNEQGLDVPVIVQTAKGSIDTAVEAMRAGAFDFVVKPVAPARLNNAITNAIKLQAIENGEKRAKKPAPSALSFDDIVTNSQAMQRVVELGQKAATSNIPILLEGETGVGKELIARAIQAEGTRRRNPFVTVNCGAIPDNLVESILFGHEKGSFTGAREKHTGKFVEAHTGTLFLDEIGDLPLDTQVKLLRAVQEGEVDPVGGRNTQKVNIRLISATNHNLIQQVKDGKFREDLFYRLNVFPIMVPPLRDRKEDIPHLVQHFIKQFSGEGTQRRIVNISEYALEMLGQYDWPGNIRQLENAVFRAVVLCDGNMLTSNDFPQIRAQVEGIDTHPKTMDHERLGGAGMGPARASAEKAEAPNDPATASEPFGVLKTMDDTGNIRTLEEVEREMIRLAIDHYNGQMSEVARRLGIGRSTLYRKLKEMGIDPNEGRLERLAS